MGRKKTIHKYHIDYRRVEIKYLVNRFIDNIYGECGYYGLNKSSLEITKFTKTLLLRLDFDEDKHVININLIDGHNVLDFLEITLLECDVRDVFDILIDDIIDFLKKNSAYHYIG